MPFRDLGNDDKIDGLKITTTQPLFMIWGRRNLKICCLNKGKVLQNYPIVVDLQTLDCIYSAQFIEGKRKFIVSTLDWLQIYSYETKRKLIKVRAHSIFFFIWWSKDSRINNFISWRDIQFSCYNQVHSIGKYDALKKKKTFISIAQPINNFDFIGENKVMITTKLYFEHRIIDFVENKTLGLLKEFCKLFHFEWLISC